MDTEVSERRSRVELIRELTDLRKRIREAEALASAFAAPARPLSAVEWALRERVKELQCLYTISSLREREVSVDRFLQGAVDCLPRSWQYPEWACARITHGERHFVSPGFQESRIRMGADVRAGGRVVGVVEVFYSAQVPETPEGPFLQEEHALIRAVAERVGSALRQMQTEAELQEAHRALQRQHQAVQETNTALRAVLSRLEEEKREIRASILSNIQKIIMPIIYELELEVTGRQRSYVTLLRQSLQDISSPFLSYVARNHMELTPVEVAISTMISNGLSTKQIAQLRCISPATVRRHRENIRRKLGLRNRKANLVTYLQGIADQAQPESAGSRPPGRAHDGHEEHEEGF